ncbi:MAG: transporter [Endomicrobiales bacterium]|jgi:hypothetical protein
MRCSLTGTTLAAVATLLCLSASIEARINLLDPWFPGQDCWVAKPGTLDTQVSFLRGQNFYEIPVSVSYVVDNPLEVGARWGVKDLNNISGIDDLILAMKYLLLNSVEHKTNICGEAGVQLPTGDPTNGIGTGAVALILHWTMQKLLKEETGYDLSLLFGLGYTINSENSEKETLGNVFWYHVGCAYDFNDYLRFYGELKGFNHAPYEQSGTVVANSDYQELYLAPGADIRFKNDLVISSAILIGLTPQSNDLGVLISTKF